MVLRPRDRSPNSSFYDDSSPISEDHTRDDDTIPMSIKTMREVLRHVDPAILPPEWTRAMAEEKVDISQQQCHVPLRSNEATRDATVTRDVPKTREDTAARVVHSTHSATFRGVGTVPMPEGGTQGHVLDDPPQTISSHKRSHALRPASAPSIEFKRPCMVNDEALQVLSNSSSNNFLTRNIELDSACLFPELLPQAHFGVSLDSTAVVPSVLSIEKSVRTPVSPNQPLVLESAEPQSNATPLVSTCAENPQPTPSSKPINQTNAMLAEVDSSQFVDVPLLLCEAHDLAGLIGANPAEIPQDVINTVLAQPSVNRIRKRTPTNKDLCAVIMAQKRKVGRPKKKDAIARISKKPLSLSKPLSSVRKASSSSVTPVAHGSNYISSSPNVDVSLLPKQAALLNADRVPLDFDPSSDDDLPELPDLPEA